MKKENISFLIAEKLSKIWIMFENGEIREYLNDNYAIKISNIPSIANIHIIEAEEDDFSKSMINGKLVNYWQMNKEGLLKINNDEPFTLEAKEGDVFFLEPMISFYHNKKTVRINESLGPSLFSIKTGNIIIKNKTIEFQFNEIKTIANGKPASNIRKENT